MRKQKRRRRKNPESGWARPSHRKPRVWFPWVTLGVLVIMGAAGLFLTVRPNGTYQTTGGRPREAAADKLRSETDAAEAVARAFLAESDSQGRLKWVRDAASVRSRVSMYPEEARAAPGEIDKMIGHVGTNGRAVTAFAVAMASGEMRLLEVVGTPDGPRVDWDAYARHGTATWEDLWSGKAQRAVVRVFCEPATEHPAPFEDRETWTCFRMSSPDLPQMALGFAITGREPEETMKKVILGTPHYRQRFVLEVARHAGTGEPLFEITRCLAVGWIVDGQVPEG